jgi:hypothetical protein
VQYLEPESQAVVDLKGQEALTFAWKKTPIPGGGRQNYKFILYKGRGYDAIESQVLDYDVYSIDIPSDKFEDGQVYTWCVKQRDDTTHVWSLYDTWAFTVKK